tara:strand:+ start:1742 stop:2872 length:1131 start_codon:yes stop_codon:yes gene_type:complete
MLRLLDLFSGIGGFSLGLESTGFFKTIAFCEKDEFCKKVLNKHWSQIPIYDDIKTINAGQISADIVSGGFPCQPFSVAGKQRGKQDDRYLWPEMLRVVTEVKPRWFIGENVSGLININEGMVLRQVCDDLEKQGFQVQCFVIPASGIGAWHQRKRVWIIGHSYENGLLATEKQRGDLKTFTSEKRKNETRQFTRTTRPNNNEYVPNTDNKRSGTSTNDFERKGKTTTNERKNRPFFESSRYSKALSNTEELRVGGRCSQKCGACKGELQQKKQKRSEIWSEAKGCYPQNVWHSESTRREGSIDRQRQREFWGTSSSAIQCKRSWWEVESFFCGVPHGLSARLDKDRSKRIQSLGNSIVPQIAREIGLAIMEAENGN